MLGTSWHNFKKGASYPVTNVPVVAGHEGKCPVYVARAMHQGHVIPGKFMVTSKQAFVTFGGKEIPAPDFEVLHAPLGSLSWVRGANGSIPANAFRGGQEATGDVYYIARAKVNGHDVAGKYFPKYGCAYFGLNGKEHTCSEFEVLVKNAYGLHLGL